MESLQRSTQACVRAQTPVVFGVQMRMHSGITSDRVPRVAGSA